MRGPILNMSPAIGASGVDMEYRRNSQGTAPRHPFTRNESSCLCANFFFFAAFPFSSRRSDSTKVVLEIVSRGQTLRGKLRKLLLSATNQLPLSPVQIQPSPPYYRQPSQDDGRKVSDRFVYLTIICIFR